MEFLTETEDLFAQVARALGAPRSGGIFGNGFQLLPIKRGLFEVDVPVVSLRALFKGERVAGFGLNHAYLEELFEQELVRSGRAAQEGPSIEWLLAHAREYLSRVIVDVTNGVISSYRREYGGDGIGYLNEEAFLRMTPVFARREDASVFFHSLNFQHINSFRLQGEWRERPLTPASVEINRQLNSDGALLRIRGLMEAGFPHEALSVANAYLEVIALPVALAVIVGDQDATKVILTSGHRSRLEIINAAAVVEPKGYVADALLKFISAAKSIYPHRNDYMHDLRSSEHEYWRTVDLDRQAKRLLAPLLDVFEMRVWFEWLFNLIRGISILSPSAIAAAQMKAKSLHK